MPPDGPLSTAELTTLKVWIDEGASWPEGVSLSVKQVVEPKSSNSIQRIMRAFGHFHPAFVHFPIAFYLVSGLAVLGTYCFGARFRSFALACLYFAAFAGIVTALMGWGFADARGYPAWDQSLATNASHDQQTFFFHRWLGTTISIFGIVVAFLGWRARNAPAEKLGHVWRLGVLLLAALVAIVGHQGGELVYGDLIEAAIRHLDK